MNYVSSPKTKQAPLQEKATTMAKHSLLPHEKMKENILSKREMEVLQLLAQGYNTTDIAQQLFISANTVDTHRKKIMEKAQAKNMIHAVVIAIKNGWMLV